MNIITLGTGIEIDLDFPVHPTHSDKGLLLRILAELKHYENINKKHHQEIMSALSDLTDAITGLSADLQTDTAAVVNAVSHIGSPAATDAQLVPLTQAINANRSTVQANTKALNDAVNAVVTPPPPAPAPAPAPTP